MLKLNGYRLSWIEMNMTTVRFLVLSLEIHYYLAINDTCACIVEHHDPVGEQEEKQKCWIVMVTCLVQRRPSQSRGGDAH